MRSLHLTQCCKKNHFQKNKALGGKVLEGIPIFSEKMDLEVVMESIEGVENHFECEGISEA